MALTFTSAGPKYQSLTNRGFVGEFTMTVTGTTGSDRGFAVTTTDVGASSIDRIEADPVRNGTTSALIPIYSSGTMYFFTGTNTGLIPVGSSTDLGTHSGLVRVYGTRA